ALREHPPACTPPNGRPNRQETMEDEPEDEAHQEQAGRQPVDPERHVTRVTTRHPGRTLARHLNRDLGARVAGANEEHAARLQLLWIAVLARMQLENVRAQLRCERGYARNLIARHRDDDMVGFEPMDAGFDQIPTADARQPIDADAAANGQLKATR